MEDFDTDASGFGGSARADAGSGSSKLVVVALAIAVVAVLVGLAGLYLATQATNALETYKAELAAKPDMARGLSALEASTKASLDDIEGRLGNMGASIVKLNRQAGGDVTKQLQELHLQTQGAFDSVSKEVKANRAQLNDTTAKLEELITRVESGAGGRASGTTSPAAVAPAASAAPVVLPEGAQVHVVQPGEFMAVIARRYGVTLTDLMAANPTVEPRRMMPGDKLVIPAK